LGAAVYLALFCCQAGVQNPKKKKKIATNSARARVQRWLRNAFGKHTQTHMQTKNRHTQARFLFRFRDQRACENSHKHTPKKIRI